MKHNKNEIFDKYEKLRNEIRAKTEEHFNKRKLMIQSSVFPYFEIKENKWKTKTINYK